MPAKPKRPARQQDPLQAIIRQAIIASRDPAVREWLTQMLRAGRPGHQKRSQK
jgi:hypothetical protein